MIYYKIKCVGEKSYVGSSEYNDVMLFPDTESATDYINYVLKINDWGEHEYTIHPVNCEDI